MKPPKKKDALLDDPTVQLDGILNSSFIANGAGASAIVAFVSQTFEHRNEYEFIWLSIIFFLIGLGLSAVAKVLLLIACYSVKKKDDFETKGEQDFCGFAAACSYGGLFGAIIGSFLLFLFGCIVGVVALIGI